MEISHLRAFRAVADTLSFTRAAGQLSLTQSAVSQQIKALEADLGEPLFVRTPHGVTLSRTGETIQEQVARILDDVDGLRDRVAGRAQATVGRVAVAMATQTLIHLFAPLLELFTASYPGVEITFRTTSSTQQTLQDVLAGKVDVGIGSLSPTVAALQVAALFDDELMLVVGRTHPLAGVRAVKVEVVRNERFVLLERGVSIRRVSDEWFERTGIVPRAPIESNDVAFIVLMVARGLGITLLPRWMVADQVASGQVAVSSLRGHHLRRTMSMFSLGRYQPAPTRVFQSFVVDHRSTLQHLASELPD